jgi:hypothetical protein
MHRLLRALMIPTVGLSFREFANPTKHLLQEIAQMRQFMNAALDPVILKLGLTPPQKESEQPETLKLLHWKAK